MKRFLVVLGLCAALGLSVLPAGDKDTKDEKREPKKCTATMEECLKNMVERFRRTGLIGLDGTWDEKLGGYTVDRFIEGSAGEAAGMKVGDILIKVNGIPLSDMERAKADSENRRPGSVVTATVLRDGKELDFTIKLIAVPADIMAAEIGKHMMEYHSPEYIAKAQ